MIRATRAGIQADRAACAWLLRRFVDFGLDDPVPWDIGRIVHEADLTEVADERFDAPEAPGLDDGLYEYCRRALLPGRDPPGMRREREPKRRRHEVGHP